MRRTITAMGVLMMCAAASQALAQEPLAFGPGEQSTYRVHYLGVSAGTAQITVGAETRQWGLPVWPIVTLATTDSLLALYPVKDRFISYWDNSARRTIGHDLYADEGRKRRRQRVRLDHSGKAAQVIKQKEGEAPNESTHEIAPGSADIAAATFVLRSQPLAVGKVYEIPVFTGAKSFTMRAEVAGLETIKTRLGDREVFKVKVQTEFSGKLAAKNDIIAYITNDDARIPVRIEAEFVVGKIVADLEEYKAGRSYAALPSLAKDG